MEGAEALVLCHPVDKNACKVKSGIRRSETWDLQLSEEKWLSDLLEPCSVHGVDLGPPPQ